MRLIENSGDEEDSSDSTSDQLEMPNPRKHKDAGEDGVHHTAEYWKSSSDKTKADWVKEEEVLNRGHKASESFAVLNELVVVILPPSVSFLLLPVSVSVSVSLFTVYCHLQVPSCREVNV